MLHSLSLNIGTVYIQTGNPTFILSGYGVFSCASGLFMFPIVYTYLYRALEVSIDIVVKSTVDLHTIKMTHLGLKAIADPNILSEGSLC